MKNQRSPKACAAIFCLAALFISVASAEIVPTPKLSDSGVFSDMVTQTWAEGVIPYEVNSPLWSDGAIKTRAISLPAGGKIDFVQDGFWAFPAQTVLVKNFYLELVAGDSATRQIIETRFLIKKADEPDWAGYSYMWNDEGTEADLLEDRATKLFFVEDEREEAGVYAYDYFFPSKKDCTACHLASAGYVLGVRTEQINREVKGENQLQVFNELGVFSEDIGGDFADFPRLVDPLDKSEDLAQRARSYLDVNCGQCHRPGAVARTILDLRYTTPLEATNAVGFFPTLGEFALEDPQIIKMGSPENSTILQRMQTLGSFRMPALATSRVDWEGAAVIEQWIQNLGRPTAVRAVDAALPASFSLEQNVPNPFNPQTHIAYQLGEQGRVVLRVYNLLGETVTTLVNEYQLAGRHTVLWNGRDSGGAAAAAGIYLYKLETQGRKVVRKMLLVK